MKRLYALALLSSAAVMSHSATLIFHPNVPGVIWTWPKTGYGGTINQPARVPRTDPVFNQLLSYIGTYFHTPGWSYTKGPDDALGYLYVHTVNYTASLDNLGNSCLGGVRMDIRYRRPHSDWNYVWIQTRGQYMWIYDPVVANLNMSGNYVPGSNLKWIIFTFPGSTNGPAAPPYVNFGSGAGGGLPFYYGGSLDSTPDLWGRWWQRGSQTAGGVTQFLDPFIQYSAQMVGVTWCGQRTLPGNQIAQYTPWTNVVFLTELVPQSWGTEVRLLDAVRYTFNPIATTKTPYGIGPGAPSDLSGGGGTPPLPGGGNPPPPLR